MRKMRLYLSSLGFGSDASFLRRPAKDGRALVVCNAMDEHGDVGRHQGLDSTIKELRALGYDADELDLREYFIAPEGDAELESAPDHDALRKRFDGVHLVWVVGGNTFVLARAMRQARFSRAIARALRDGSLTYGGFSAGACVAGPDLQGIRLMDDPDVLPDGYDPSVEPEALGLVPFRIVPHWQSSEPFGPGGEPLGVAAATAAAWMT